MPSINMIAPRRAEKLRLQRDIRRLVMVVIAEVLFAVCLGGWMCTMLWSTQIKITGLDRQIEKLQPVIKQIEDFESATNNLTPKLELLGHAKNQTMCWYNTLDKLTQSLPDATYLTRIATSVNSASTDKQAETVVNLTGVSSAQARVGETMMRLQTIPDFSKVDLSFTRKSGAKDTGIEFQIDASMKSEQPSKGVKADGSNQS